MGNSLELGTEDASRERAITSLIESTSTPAAEVRRLFANEYARLELHAKVRAHLQALTIANVRQMLHQLAVTPQPAA